jgi:hypothetical protein
MLGNLEDTYLVIDDKFMKVGGDDDTGQVSAVCAGPEGNTGQGARGSQGNWVQDPQDLSCA